jgi:hypothetical protein
MSTFSSLQRYLATGTGWTLSRVPAIAASPLTSRPPRVFCPRQSTSWPSRPNPRKPEIRGSGRGRRLRRCLGRNARRTNEQLVAEVNSSGWRGGRFLRARRLEECAKAVSGNQQRLARVAEPARGAPSATPNSGRRSVGGPLEPPHVRLDRNALPNRRRAATALRQRQQVARTHGADQSPCLTVTEKGDRWIVTDMTE